MTNRKTAADVLAALVEDFGVLPNEERKKVWDVLTALRGPDGVHDADDLLKQSTTCVIRRRLFGDALSRLDPLGYPYAAQNGDTPARAAQRATCDLESVPVSAASKHPHAHFIRHAQRAFRALGLKWTSVNGED